MAPLFRWLAGALVSISFSCGAYAQGMIGATVSYVQYCCSGITPSDIIDTGTFVVGDGVELPIGSAFGPGLTDVSAFQILSTAAVDGFFVPGSFNGSVTTFTFMNPNVRIASIVVNPSSTFVPLDLRLDGNTITHNVAGQPFSAGDFTLIDVTLVPEPSTYALMLTGLGLIGYAARRRRKS